MECVEDELMKSFLDLPRDILDGDCTLNKIACEILSERQISNEMMMKESANNVSTQLKNKREDLGPCKVCGTMKKTCFYLGIVACHSCRSFFRRSILRGAREPDDLPCRENLGNSSECLIDSKSWKSCMRCRFSRCLKAGLSAKRVKSKLPKELDIATIAATAETAKLTYIFDEHMEAYKHYIRTIFLDNSSSYRLRELVTVSFGATGHYSSQTYSAVIDISTKFALNDVFCNLLKDSDISEADIQVRNLFLFSLQNESCRHW